MTAQIGIFNKKGVALAADSAVTISNGDKQKAFNTAEKLFELIPGVPVGIMTYNNAEFMGIPYEVLIKQYKNYDGCRLFDDLEGFHQSFLEFIRDTNYITRESGIHSIGACINWHINEIIRLSLENHQSRVLSKEESYSAMLNGIEKYEEIVRDSGRHVNFYDVNIMELFEDYNGIFEECVNESFGILNEMNDSNNLGRVTLLLKESLVSNIVSGNNSGIVIAGYGKDDIFPKEFTTIVEFTLKGRLKSIESSHVVINNQVRATIRTYAQGEMAEAFIDGMNPNIRIQINQMLQNFLYNIGDYFSEVSEPYKSSNSINENDIMMNEHAKGVLDVLGRALFDTFMNNINEMQRQMVIPFMDTVENLNKQEIAELAENLVNVTSLKRKISMDTDSVGGPIDVAIITKNEGLIWIKRKYFFDRESNPFYTEKKRREYHDFIERCRV